MSHFSRVFRGAMVCPRANSARCQESVGIDSCRLSLDWMSPCGPCGAPAASFILVIFAFLDRLPPRPGTGHDEGRRADGDGDQRILGVDVLDDQVMTFRHHLQLVERKDQQTTGLREGGQRQAACRRG